MDDTLDERRVARHARRRQIPARHGFYLLILGLLWGFGDDWLRIGGVKMFADGALGSLTALMIDPYEGHPGNVGLPVMQKEALLEAAIKASVAGLPSLIQKSQPISAWT